MAFAGRVLPSLIELCTLAINHLTVVVYFSIFVQLFSPRPA